ncbi:hypothetical protein [Novosphingobium sp.]|uniref:hypothetical protein n=1 Tax=Novosphingobium sp. TaxID=1874826 RepID=UPI00261F2D14|nr:hypothetical protein [Novosphingobium sp.]
MRKARSPRTVVPAGFFPKLLLPFAAPILLTLLLALLVGETVPRTIAPGSGLKLAGFCCAAMFAALAWRWSVRCIADRRAHSLAALACAVTGLLGWPVWTVGILPSVNGLSLHGTHTVSMKLERTEVTTISRSRRLNHWAWLKPDTTGSIAGSGRYFIPEAVHANWASRQGRMVTLTVAQGLLGASVVIGYR